MNAYVKAALEVLVFCVVVVAALGLVCGLTALASQASLAIEAMPRQNIIVLMSVAVGTLGLGQVAWVAFKKFRSA